MMGLEYLDVIPACAPRLFAYTIDLISHTAPSSAYPPGLVCTNDHAILRVALRHRH